VNSGELLDVGLLDCELELLVLVRVDVEVLVEVLEPVPEEPPAVELVVGSGVVDGSVEEEEPSDDDTGSSELVAVSGWTWTWLCVAREVALVRCRSAT
jgi:hypothetical protein